MTTAYDAMNVWAKNVPDSLQIIWFTGTGRTAAYNHITAEYECVEKKVSLYAVALTRNEYIRYRRNNPNTPIQNAGYKNRIAIAGSRAPDFSILEQNHMQLTYPTLDEIASTLGWKQVNGQYQLQAWIDMLNYATWLGFNTDRVYAEQRQMLKDEHPDLTYQIDHTLLSDKRHILQLLDTLDQNGRHVERFEDTLLLLAIKLNAHYISPSQELSS